MAQQSGVNVTIRGTPSEPPPKTMREFVERTAQRFNVPNELAFEILDKESSGVHQLPGQDIRTSDAGAQGFFQLLPSTAYGEFQLDSKDPFQNIEAGVRYLRQALDRNAGDVERAAMYYHGGPDVQQWGPITQAYGKDILARVRKRLAAAQSATAAGGAAAGTTQPPPVRQGVTVPTAEELQAMTQPRTQPTTAARGTGATDPLTTAWNRVKPFFSELQSLNPAPLYQGMVGATQAIIDDPKAAFAKVPDLALAVAKGMGQSNAEMYQKAVDAYNRGDYLEAGLHAKNYLLGGIGVGQRLEAAEEYMRQGDYLRGAGATADTLAMVAPEGLRRLPGQARVVPPLKSHLPPEKRAAVEFGLQHDIPVDVSTATGNRAVRRFQGAMESTPLGGMVHGRVVQQRGQRLTTVGEELADRVYPGRVDPEGAGASVRRTLETEIAGRHGEANTAYDALRRIEADPRHTQQVQTGTQTINTGVLDINGNPITRTIPVMEAMQLPVDLRVVKQRLRPLYDRLRRQLPVTQQEASPGLRALQNILDGPDFAPATQVDIDLGTIKGLARGADLPELRDVSQGLAAKGVQALSDAVDAAVARAGPRAQAALKEGRRATMRKYATAEILDQLRDEPVGAFRQMTASGDQHINYLRALQKEAPAEMPKVARAILDDLLGTATQRGGYEQAASVANKWERLGPETRKILFGPQHSEALDQFFLLSRMLAEHPNPSQTALTIASTLSGAWLMANPMTGVPANLVAGGMAALLNSQRGVRLLTRGLTIPAASTAAVAWGAEMANLLGRDVKQAADEEGRAPAQSRLAMPPPRPPIRAIGAGPGPASAAPPPTPPG